MRTRFAASSLIYLLAAVHAEVHIVRHQPIGHRSSLEATSLPEAEFSVPLAGKTSRGTEKNDLLVSLLRHGQGGTKAKSTTVPTGGTGFQYFVNVKVGGQPSTIAIDTGSSDTWFVQKGFQCLDVTSHIPVPENQCGFGPTLFDPSKSKTFKLFPHTTFGITYGDHTFVQGPAGFDTVSIGGLEVTKQEIGAPNIAGFRGAGVIDGLLGLAFPTLTSVFNTTDPSHAPQIPYNPFFFTAVQQKKIKHPFFSTALNRLSLADEIARKTKAHVGFLAFGGIAPVPVTKTAVTVPIQGYSVSTGTLLPTKKNPQYFFYTVDIQEYTFPGSKKIDTKNMNTVLDSGTSLNLVPDDVAAGFAAQFKPPAQFNTEISLYLVDCKAKAPAFSAKIGGKTFRIDPRDQIVPLATDDQGNIHCGPATQPNGPNVPQNIFILGDVFLKNVVTTYNPIDKHVTITQRKPY
ncbi:acid protease [Mycena crocata]|nr:acid protease [Mycena crocata]